MLTGRQKIEAAFSREGSREFAATDCWEYVFIRDHWEWTSMNCQNTLTEGAPCSAI